MRRHLGMSEFDKLQKMVALFAAALLLAAAAPAPQAGRQDADCRAGEPGPALNVEVVGLKDRRGLLRVELYPANANDYLNADKIVRRIEVTVPAQTNPVLCIRAPHAGAYAVAVVHDRDSNRRFSPFTDGVTATGNIPNLGRGKPPVANATVMIGPGVSHARAVMQYLRMFGFAPLG